MKKTLTILAFVLVASFGFSQNTTYGVRGGLNISNLDFTPDADFENKHRNGFVFGGFADLGLTESLSLMIEMQYSAEGGKEEPLSLGYIQFPIQLRYALSYDLTIGVGPQFSIVTWDSQNIFSKYGVSGVGSIEYMIGDILFIDARYSYGFTNVLDTETINGEAKNHNIQLGIGIKM